MTTSPTPHRLPTIEEKMIELGMDPNDPYKLLPGEADPYAKPKRHIGVGTFAATDKMRQLVAQVLDSGRISYGPMSLEFEQRFAALHNCQYGILSNSGTSSLQVALQAMKEIHHWPDGSRVILPVTTFVATANIILHNRLVPVYVDVDPHTYNINVDLIDPSLTKDTKAIIPVSLFGQPANLSRVRDIADAHHLAVLTDSCETMFVNHNDRSCGEWGDITCFSMYVAHLLVTGVGGIATTNNPDYAGRMRQLVNHGMELQSLNPGANFSPQPAPGRRFKFESHGHSYRITELESALGLAQLDDIDWNILAPRRRNARHLTQGLKNINEHYVDTFQLPTISDGNESAWMMYPIVLKRGDKESLMAHLLSYGVECRDMLPILGQPAPSFRYLRNEDYPVSANLVKNGLYIGCHQGITPDDCKYLVDVLGLWVKPDFPAIYVK